MRWRVILGNVGITFLLKKNDSIIDGNEINNKSRLLAVWV